MPRYQAATVHIVDSLGAFGQQIMSVVFDRQYSRFIFKYRGQTIIPAESLYAVFEAKQPVNAALVTYVRRRSPAYGGCTGRAYRSRTPRAHPAQIPDLPCFFWLRGVGFERTTFRL
jgi:hypothetical protein